MYIYIYIYIYIYVYIFSNILEIYFIFLLKSVSEMMTKCVNYNRLQLQLK